jgi:hypothetical protein
MAPPVSEREEIVGPSDRSFGLIFTVVFAIVATAPLWRGGPLRLWALGVSAVFLFCALLAPRVLHPLNIVWLHIGLVLHRIVNPVVTGALFYLVVTPFGLARRALGGGLARQLRRDPAARTYWISRRDQPFSPMDRQF